MTNEPGLLWCESCGMQWHIDRKCVRCGNVKESEK
jgi:formate dehydrogenase maturation protein FdhE